MIKKIKHPRISHLPWSPGNQSDDLVMKNTKHFEGKEVVITEKMDGENTTFYADYMHARSINYRHHPSRAWVKNLHAQIAYLIPNGWRICGENVFAKHSIAYHNLESYFYLFSVWNDQNNCLSWQETIDWAKNLGLATPRVLYRGPWQEKKILSLSIDTDQIEGYVVRSAHDFAYEAFSENVAKWVRKNHVETDEGWLHHEVVPNQLGTES